LRAQIDATVGGKEAYEHKEAFVRQIKSRFPSRLSLVGNHDQ